MATTGSGKRGRTVILVLAGFLLVGFAAWWFLVRSEAPPAPQLAAAVETAMAAQQPVVTGVSTTEVLDATTTSITAMAAQQPVVTGVPTTEVLDATTTSPTASSVELSGIWTVDPDIGLFQDFTSTWVGYRIDEELGNGIGATTAVGRTPLVAATVVLAENVVVSVEVVADLRGLKSDRAWRDDKVLKALHVNQYPEARFVLGSPIPLVAGTTASEITVSGVLTVNGVAVDVETRLEATLVGDVLAVVGSLPVVLSDHGVEAPSAPIVVSVADSGVVEFQIFMTRTAASG